MYFVEVQLKLHVICQDSGHKDSGHKDSGHKDSGHKDYQVIHNS